MLLKECSLIKNMVCKIRTNLSISIIELVSVIGGQLTDRIPGSRHLIFIDNQSYSILIFKTGQVIITNVCQLSKLKEITRFFNALFVYMIQNGIATVNHNCNIIKLYYLIENFHFAFSLLNPINAQQMSILFRNIKYEHFRCIEKNLVIEEKKHKQPFPAQIIKCYIERCDLLNILNVKSSASRKRHPTRFKHQKVSCHVFKNGKYIVTGGQTKSDFSNLFILLQQIFKHACK